MSDFDDKNCSFVSCVDDTYYFERGVSDSELIHAASCVMESSVVEKGETFTNPSAVSTFVRMKLGMSQREVFAVMFLNNKHELIKYEEMFFGTVSECSVYPREIVKKALEYNCCAVVLAHNHPSGNIEPSQADRNITVKIKSALDTVGIRILDHLIVCSLVQYCSFAERGLL